MPTFAIIERIVLLVLATKEGELRPGSDAKRLNQLGTPLSISNGSAVLPT